MCVCVCVCGGGGTDLKEESRSQGRLLTINCNGFRA